MLWNSNEDRCELRLPEGREKGKVCNDWIENTNNTLSENIHNTVEKYDSWVTNGK